MMSQPLQLLERERDTVVERNGEGRAPTLDVTHGAVSVHDESTTTIVRERDTVVEGNADGRAPSFDIRQEVDVNEVTINRKVIPIADSEESRKERGNEIERTGDNGLVRESEDSVGAHPDREDTVVRVNHGDEEVQGNGGSSESVGNRTESDVGRCERGLGARADGDRLIDGRGIEKVPTQRTQQNTETSQDSGPANANIDMNTKIKKYSEMLHSKLILGTPPCFC